MSKSELIGKQGRSTDSAISNITNNWTIQQQSQTMQNEQLLQPGQPQVTILKRNRNNIVTPAQVSQVMMRPEVGDRISSWSVGPNAY